MPIDSLIFIDTNILLDFYRVRAGGTGLSILKHIDQNHERIITGSQVEMEYKKNRQKVIQESLGQIKAPDWNAAKTPAFLSEAQAVQAIEKCKKDVSSQIKTIKARIERVLKNPSRNDLVYQCLQRLFTNKGPYNLGRHNKIRYKIRRLAWKRFILGYPPRKNSDTSMGDAVNWEWMVHCAEISGKDIVIVTRDSDYGIIHEKEAVLNDWLSLEFKERVSRKRQIRLTDRLSEGFKLASIQVSKKEEEEEKQMIKDIGATEPEAISPQARSPNSFETWVKLFQELQKLSTKS